MKKLAACNFEDILQVINCGFYAPVYATYPLVDFEVHNSLYQRAPT